MNNNEQQCRLVISDPSGRVFTLVAQLGLDLESKTSPDSELSQCEIPHYVPLHKEEWQYTGVLMPYTWELGLALKNSWELGSPPGGVAPTKSTVASV